MLIDPSGVSPHLLPRHMHMRAGMRRLAASLRGTPRVTRHGVELARGLSSTQTDFGFRDVAAGDKEKLVKEVFSKVAAK